VAVRGYWANLCEVGWSAQVRYRRKDVLDYEARCLIVKFGQKKALMAGESSLGLLQVGGGGGDRTRVRQHSA